MRALAAQRYALGRAFAMTRDRPFAFLLAVALTASALALPLSLASVLWAASPVAVQMRPSAEVSVFLSPRATASEVDALRRRLASLPEVVEVDLHSKDAALADLVRRSGFSAAPAELAPNPLPDVLVARLTVPVARATLDRLDEQVKGWSLVESVRTDLDWYAKVQAIGRLGLTAVALFGALGFAVVVLVLAGAVRLHAVTRADEVAVLRLIGATNRFIVRPYAYSAAVTLLTATVFAVTAVYAMHAALRGPLAELTTLYGAPFALPAPEPLHLLAVFTGSVLIGWMVGAAGARVSIGRGDGT